MNKKYAEPTGSTGSCGLPLVSEAFRVRLPGAGAPGREARRESWAAMELALRLKKVRAIGVSNYEVGHLQDADAGRAHASEPEGGGGNQRLVLGE